MKILVTGGAGFIGVNFVVRAVELGQDVSVLDLFTYASNREALQKLKAVQIHEGDIRDSDLVERLVKQADTVVHLVAESHNDNSLKNPELFVSTNVFGTLTVIQACSKFDTRFHHVSTDEVFGDLPLDSAEKFTEESPYKPSSPYSASKAASDHLVRSWVRSFGLQATISNCSNNYGPYQHAEKLIPRTVKLIRNGQKPKIFGKGLNIRDWIHVTDHVSGIFAALEKGRIGETYLFGAGNEKTNLEVVQTILRFFGKEDDFIEFIPDRAGHDLRYAIDTSKATNELGWQATESNFEAYFLGNI